MNDITPELIEKIKEAFSAELKKSNVDLQKIVENGATYDDAYKLASVIGNARAKAFKLVLNSDVLPDGKMYFNIADRIIREFLPSDYDDITAIAAEAQKVINAAEGIGIKAITTEVEEDRLLGFINRLSYEDNFDDVAWILEEPVKTLYRTAVDDTIKKNAEFQNKAGVVAQVVRTSSGHCCEWCNNLSGVYTYPGVPSEVFMRHDNCTCTLTYRGQKLNAFKRNFRLN